MRHSPTIPGNTCPLPNCSCGGAIAPRQFGLQVTALLRFYFGDRNPRCLRQFVCRNFTAEQLYYLSS